MLTFTLHNGSHTKEAWNENSSHFVDDWKPESKSWKAVSVSDAYGFTKVELEDGSWIEMQRDNDGFIEHDGVFYGDWTVSTGSTS